LYISPNIGVTPKTNLALIAVFSFVLLVAWRRLFYNLSLNTFTRLVVFVGEHPLFNDLAHEFNRHSHLGKVVRVQNFSFDRSLITHSNVLFVSEYADPKTLIELAKIPGAQVLSLFEAYRTIFAKIPLELMSDEKAVSMIATQDHAGVRYLYRIIEVVLALCVLGITSPIVGIAAIAIWAQDGKPILLRQKRVGKNGTVFTLYKLRTMKVLSKDGSAETHGVQWATDNDPRITPVGRILRKTHIDEIPQMFNIIKGDLALVGPRAERPEFVATLEEKIPYYYLRHTIKPGFTGWAQIKFRYARSIEDSKEKFEYDLCYLKNKSPLLDVGIVLKTLQIIFTH
jgi:lipopolysaccharide/colanic/teichoic acid biosynthesis glycosyltransferase